MEFFSSINLQEENPTFPTEIKDFPWNSLNNSGTPRNLLQIPQNFRNSLEISENTSRILRNLLEIPQNSQKSLRNPLTSSKSLKNLQKSLEPPFSDLPRPSPDLPLWHASCYAVSGPCWQRRWRRSWRRQRCAGAKALRCAPSSEPLEQRRGIPPSQIRELNGIWVWVNTYRYISGMNIHKSQLWIGVNRRYQGFDPSPYGGLVV